MAPVADILAAWPGDDYRRCYLTGPGHATVADARRWAAGTGQLPEGWEPDPKRPHHLATAKGPVLHFLHHGSPVSVLRAAAWFGEGDYRPDDALAALRLLWRAIRAEPGWRDGGVFDTPQTTGRDLWARLIGDDAWPVLSPEVRELIHAVSGQSRHEGWWEREGVVMPAELGGLHVWDGALMYAALCSELGSGPVALHDQGDTWPGPELGGGYAPGWYRVSWDVPECWAPSAPAGIVGGPRDQLGLLGVQTDDGWRWPNRGRHTGWVSSAELLFAWRAWGPAAFTIHERLILTRAGKGPLHTWADRLIRVRQQIGAEADPAVAQLARRAVRSMVIFSIGAFAARQRQRTVTAPSTRPGLADWTRTDAGYVWTEDEEGPWDTMVHPEWAAQVWARCRARMLSHRSVGALHVDPRDVVAVYADALYLAGDPGWPTEERPGRLRPKLIVPGPLATPASWSTVWDVAGA